jgi:hypothetical protein
MKRHRAGGTDDVVIPSAFAFCSDDSYPGDGLRYRHDLALAGAITFAMLRTTGAYVRFLYGSHCTCIGQFE